MVLHICSNRDDAPREISEKCVATLYLNCRDDMVAGFYCELIAADGTTTSLDMTTIFGASKDRIWVLYSLFDRLKVPSRDVKFSIVAHSLSKYETYELFGKLKTYSFLDSLQLEKCCLDNCRTMSKLVGVFESNTAISNLDILECEFNFVNVCECAFGSSCEFRFAGGQCSLFGDFLKNNSSLTSLAILFGSLALGDVPLLCEAMISNTSIKHLNLADNGLDDSCISELDMMMKKNSTVAVLGLGWSKFSPYGMSSLFELLRNNSTLAAIDFSGGVWEQMEAETGSIGDLVMLRTLGEALKTNTTLTGLALNQLQIGDSGAKILCEALELNTTLTKLLIPQAGISVGGACAFGKMLKMNNTLENVDLSGNYVGSEGVVHIAESLKTNSRLFELQLASNMLTDDGVSSLFEALKSNSALRALAIGWHNDVVDARGLVSLCGMLEANSTLETLYIHCPQSIGDPFARSLHESFERNSSLKSICLDVDFLVPWPGTMFIEETNEGKEKNKKTSLVLIFSFFFVVCSLFWNWPRTHFELDTESTNQIYCLLLCCAGINFPQELGTLLVRFFASYHKLAGACKNIFTSLWPVGRCNH